RPTRPGRGLGAGISPTTAVRQSGYSPRALGPAAPLPMAATPPAWRAAARASGRPARAVSASLQAWHRDRRMYQPLARACAAVALACLGVGAARPAPLLLGLALVLLLAIPWGLAVAHRLANSADSPIELTLWPVPQALPVHAGGGTVAFDRGGGSGADR